MIRNHREYTNAREQIADFQRQAQATREALAQQGFADEDIALANASVLAFAQDLAVDCAFYDELISTGPSAVPAFSTEDRGKALVALRIACGVTQRQLADKLDVAEAQVSRDERNEYHGIRQDRYAAILKALRVAERGLRFVRDRPAVTHHAYMEDRRTMGEFGIAPSLLLVGDEG